MFFFSLLSLRGIEQESWQCLLTSLPWRLQSGGTLTSPHMQQPSKGSLQPESTALPPHPEASTRRPGVEPGAQQVKWSFGDSIGLFRLSSHAKCHWGPPALPWTQACCHLLWRRTNGSPGCEEHSGLSGTGAEEFQSRSWWLSTGRTSSDVTASCVWSSHR